MAISKWPKRSHSLTWVKLMNVRTMRWFLLFLFYYRSNLLEFGLYVILLALKVSYTSYFYSIVLWTVSVCDHAITAILNVAHWPPAPSYPWLTIWFFLSPWAFLRTESWCENHWKLMVRKEQQGILVLTVGSSARRLHTSARAFPET